MIDIHPATLGLNQSGATELRKMVAHCRFGQTDAGSEIAAAHLSGVGAEQQRDQLDPDRVGESLETQRDVERSVVVEGPGGHWRAAQWGRHIYDR